MNAEPAAAPPRHTRMLEERADRLEFKPAGSLVLVLDASAPDMWDRVLDASRSIANRAHHAVGRVYVLGSDAPYSVEDLKVPPTEWLRYSSTRLSVLQPVIRAEQGWLGVSARAGASSAMVVLHHSRIYDRDDYTALQQQRQLVLADITQEGGIATAVGVVDRLRRRAARVEIGGPGWMPYWWNNPLYRWTPKEARLVGELGPDTDGDLAVTVHGFLPCGGELQAETWWPDHARAPVPLHACPLDAGDQRAVWQTLPLLETEMVQAIRRGEDFPCPHGCGQRHGPRERVCTGENGKFRLKKSLRPPFDAAPGLVLLRQDGRRLQFLPLRQNVVRLGPGDVAIAVGDTLRRQRFVPAGDGGTWHDVGEIAEPYFSRDDRCLVTLT